jgi:signal transduction histidine kinase
MKEEQSIINSIISVRKSVRMRKHALTQSLSAIEAMFYSLNSFREKHDVLHNEDIISRVKKITVQEAFEFIAQSLKDMMPALEHIAAVEYSFGKPEWIDPEKFIEEFIQNNEKGWLNFKPITTWKQGHNLAIQDVKDPSSGEIILRKGDSINQLLFPKDALERVFNNIISNAKAHGFKDKSRNDYQLRFSWRMDGLALIVEIENNGSPIPNDRETASLLEYGVSTDLHNDGHNGIGCNEIDDIMQRYEGKVEIVSLPNDEFPVRYILTFNRSNTIRTFKL